MIIVFITIKLKRLTKILIIIAAAAAVIWLIAAILSDGAEPVINIDSDEYTLVLDPGHGGIDGGAIADSGLKESDVNLAITQRMELLAAFLGVNCVTTRNTDTDNRGDGEYSEHDNLIARAELANSTPKAVLISVHQNQYPSPVVRGAEVLFAHTEGSEELARLAQDNFVSKLDPENRRVMSPAPDKLLLTSSVKCPAILAECGFMSCPDEASKLGTPEYQLKIAQILIASFLQYIVDKTSV